MDIFTVIQILLMILVISFSGVALINKRFEEIVPVTIPLIVTILYFFGIFNFLEVGFYFINYSSAILILISLWVKRCELRNVLCNFLSPGLLIYLIWCLVIYFYVKDFYFIHHDVFSHWGLAAKNTLLTDAIAIGQKANTVYQDYPPATALFQYWMLKINGQFNESLATYSMSLWGISILIYPLKYLQWKSIKTLILYLFAGILFPLAFRYAIQSDMNFYITMQVDQLLALIFGYILLLFFTVKKDLSLFVFFKIAISLFTIVLIKKVGLFIAITAAMVIIYDIILSKKKLEFFFKKGTFGFLLKSKFDILKQKYLKRFKFTNKISQNDVVLYSLCFLLPIFIANISWGILVDLYSANKISLNYAHRGIIDNIFSLKFHKILAPHASEVFPIYAKAVYNLSITNGAIKLSYLGIVTVITCFIWYLYESEKNIAVKKRIKLITKVFGSLFAIYALGHLLMYVSILSPGESGRLSSFIRYINIFLMAIIFMALGLFMHQGFVGNIKKYKNLSYILMLAIILMQDKLNFDLTQYRTKETSLKYSNSMIPVVKVLDNHLGKNLKSNTICHIESSSSKVKGMSYGIDLFIKYIMAPLKSRRFIIRPNGKEITQREEGFFIDEMNLCSHVIIYFDPKDSMIDNFYKNYFKKTKLMKQGLYLIERNNDSFKFNLIDKTNYDFENNG